MAGMLNFRRYRVLYFLLIISSVVPHKEDYSSFKRTTSHTDISNGFEQSRRVDLLDFLRGWEGIQVKLTKRFWRTNRAFCETSKRDSTCFAIDHFHKWRPTLHSFVFMLIRPTALVLKQIFF